jgi:hypothetical protein
MPRRASSGINAGVLIGVGVFIVVAAVAGFFLLRHKSSTFGDVPKLRIAEFLENGNSLRGNEYVVEGKIDEKLRWTPSRGQVVSIRVDDNGRTELIGIEIPAEFNDLNIEREQRYAFRIRVRQGGIPVATGIERL